MYHIITKYHKMYAFILFFIAFYAIVVNRFSTVRSALLGASQNIIPLPTKLIESWILVTQSLFPLQAILTARKSGWELDSSLQVVALILGVLLGFLADIK